MWNVGLRVPITYVSLPGSWGRLGGSTVTFNACGPPACALAGSAATSSSTSRHPRPPTSPTWHRIRPPSIAQAVACETSNERPHGTPPPHPPVRAPRGRRSAARAVRGLGDAGAVRGDPAGARERAHERRPVRRLAHGRDRDERPTGGGVPAADPVER